MAPEILLGSPINLTRQQSKDISTKMNGTEKRSDSQGWSKV